MARGVSRLKQKGVPSTISTIRWIKRNAIQRLRMSDLQHLVRQVGERFQRKTYHIDSRTPTRSHERSLQN